ncbi:MAG: hypothetical protein FWH04_03000 [Oscillospiraceae bacterium]|nr:hypothetical protein [Oscillospiraceae bacterium]
MTKNRKRLMALMIAFMFLFVIGAAYATTAGSLTWNTTISLSGVVKVSISAGVFDSSQASDTSTNLADWIDASGSHNGNDSGNLNAGKTLTADLLQKDGFIIYALKVKNESSYDITLTGVSGLPSTTADIEVFPPSFTNLKVDKAGGTADIFIGFKRLTDGGTSNVTSSIAVGYTIDDIGSAPDAMPALPTPVAEPAP